MTEEKLQQSSSSNKLDDSIRPNDVLLGRGGATNNHVGNREFRKIVGEYQPEYLRARKKEKVTVARKIVALVHDKGGRFLKRCTDSDTWIEVTEKRAQEKTSQALREGLDVRHFTMKATKAIRNESKSVTQPKKKYVAQPKMMKGKVASSPATHALVSPEQKPSLHATIPDFHDEPNSELVLKNFNPPSVTKIDMKNSCAI